jgi:hypothetical protein
MRVVYILQDCGRPDIVKIGKASDWPERFSQALSQSPRQVLCVATWHYEDRSGLDSAERAAQAGLIRFDTGNNNKEWYNLSAEKAVPSVAARLGRQPDETSAMPGRRSWHGAGQWDAWRDKAEYKTTAERRRLWVGAEFKPNGTIGVLKVVHSPYYDGFFTFTPTYSCSKFRWLGRWETPGQVFTEQSNRAVYDIWHRLVAQFGQGSRDTAVGWLRNPDGSAKIEWPELCEFMRSSGFVWVDPRSPKPLDAREKDPENGGIRLPYGVIPPQRLIHSTSSI